MIEPQSNEIRYVGQTKSTLDRRLYLHLFKVASSDRTDHRTTWLARQARLGLPPRIELVQEVDLQFLDEAEIYWIAHFKSMGCPLVNHHKGGNGGWDHMKGRPGARKGVTLSDETREAISKKLVGRKLPQSTRNKMSIARQRDRQLISARTTQAWAEGQFSRSLRPARPSWFGSTICPVCDKGPFKSYQGMRKHMTQTECARIAGAEGRTKFSRSSLANMDTQESP